MQVTQLLQDLLPGTDCDSLTQQASEINAMYVRGEINSEERQSLLEDLVNTQIIQEAASAQDRQIMLDQALKLLMAAPLPS